MLSFSCLSRDLRVVLRAKVIWKHSSEVSSFKSSELWILFYCIVQEWKWIAKNKLLLLPLPRVSRKNLKKIIQLTNWKKIPDIFLRFEADLDFSRPWFSEIKVQIKRPTDRLSETAPKGPLLWKMCFGRSNQLIAWLESALLYKTFVKRNLDNKLSPLDNRLDFFLPKYKWLSVHKLYVFDSMSKNINNPNPLHKTITQKEKKNIKWYVVCTTYGQRTRK